MVSSDLSELSIALKYKNMCFFLTCCRQTVCLTLFLVGDCREVVICGPRGGIYI